jgi:DNA-binding LacI/PurR family transcriptional regulator
MNSPKEAESLGRGDPPGDEPKSTARRLSDLSKNITMAQIAKAAGVSQGAISSLLNDRDYGIRVSEKTRDRVFKVCREMGYLPNDLRAVVRMYPELGDYCILICRQLGMGLDHPFLSRIAATAMRSVPDPSRPITFAFYDEGADYSANHDLLPQPVRAGVASKFIGLGPANLALLQAIQRRGLAFVSIGHEIAQAGVVSVMPDFSQASQLALEALVKLGHRRIAIVSGPFGTANPQVLELNRGVRMAYDRLSIPIEAQNIIYGDLTFAAGLEACNTLLVRTPAPTAIFCMSDAVAAGIVAQAQARGCKVPDDVSVIGCSDDPLCERTLPALATIHLPAEEMARLAMSEVDHLVRDSALSDPERKTVPVRLVERASLGPAPRG